MKTEMLAAAHWAYVESVLQLHGEALDVIEKCGEHYRAAFCHGFKHGIESLVEIECVDGAPGLQTRLVQHRVTYTNEVKAIGVVNEESQ